MGNRRMAKKVDFMRFSARMVSKFMSTDYTQRSPQWGKGLMCIILWIMWITWGKRDKYRGCGGGERCSKLFGEMRGIAGAGHRYVISFI